MNKKIIVGFMGFVVVAVFAGVAFNAFAAARSGMSTSAMKKTQAKSHGAASMNNSATSTFAVSGMSTSAMKKTQAKSHGATSMNNSATSTSAMNMENGKGKSHGEGSMMNMMATSTMQSAEQIAAMDAHRKAIDVAIKASDYTAWRAAMVAFHGADRGANMMGSITKDNFVKFVEMRKLMDQVDIMRKGLGIGMSEGMGSGMHGGGQGMEGAH